MLAPDSALNEHYRITYVVDDRPDCVIYRAIDQRDSLRVLIAELPQVSEEALGDVRLLAGQITAVSTPGLLTLRDHFAHGLTYYLVAEDAGGQDLERVARDRGGPLPESEVLMITDRLLGMLDVLHERSPALMMGDLRPTDLWSSPDGGLFLAPFALARHMGPEPSPYRAPELHDSHAEPTTSSDIYALGAVLYQLLTGWAPPLAPQRLVGTPLNSPRVLNARVSALAEQLVLRALELKAVNRYQRAREMRSALETVRLMAGRPLGALAPVITEELRTVSPGATPPPPPNPIPPIGAAPGVPGYGPPPPAPPQPAAPQGYPPQPAAPQGYPPQPAYPTQPPQYASYGAPTAPARPRISNGCLIAIVAVLAIVALVVCAVGVYVGYVMIFNRAGLPFLPGVAAMATSPASPSTSGAAPAVGSAATPGPAAALTQGAVFTQTRQLEEDAVGAAAYSPDGSLLAVALGNNIQLRQGDELDPGTTLSGHSTEVVALAFSPDGRLLASSGQEENSVRLWDVASGEQLRSFAGHTGWVRSLAFSPDGRLLASGSIDQSIRLWNPADGSEVAVLEGHTGWLGNIAFSPDGATLASAARDGTVKFWDVQAGSLRAGVGFTAPENPESAEPFWLNGLSYSPDGARIAVGSVSGSVFVLDAASGRQQRELRGHQSLVVIRGVAFSPDGNLIASTGFDGTVRLWSPRTGMDRGVLRQGGLRMLGLSWHPDGQRLAAASDVGGVVTVWDVPAEEIQRTLRLAQGAVTALAYSESGEVLGTGGASGTVRLHIFPDDRQETLPGGAPTSQYIGFVSETRLAAVSDAGDVVLVDLTSGGESQQLEGLEGFALNLVVSRDRRLIAAGNERGEVTIWDAETLELQRTLRGLDGPVSALAFNRDASLIAAVSNQPVDSPEIMLWNVQTGDRAATLSGHEAPITGVELPAGEGVAVSASSDGTLRVWATDDGRELRSISAAAEEGWFNSFAFSPDGSLLVTGSLTGTVEFWNPQSGELLNRIELGQGSVLALAFRSDGRQIAASTRDGGVFLLEPAA